MLFGQLLTAATAVSFASEAIGLRQEVLDREARMEQTERDRGYAARRVPAAGRGARKRARRRSVAEAEAAESRATCVRRSRPVSPLPPPSARAACLRWWRVNREDGSRDRDQPRDAR